MYLLLPGAAVQALDAPPARSIWEYKRPSGSVARQDARDLRGHVYLHRRPTASSWRSTRAPARCAGRRRRPAASPPARSSSKARCIPGRTCAPRRENCYIAAHDAKTGRKLWRFYTAAGDDEPGGDDVGRRAGGDARRPRPGGCPAATIRCAGWFTGASPTRCRTRARRGTAATLDAIPTYVAGRSLQQLDGRAESRHRQAGVVLPAPARRRLGRGLHPRAHAVAHGGQPGSEVREVDQPGRPPRRAARHGGHGRRGRRHLGARSRQPASSCGRRRSRSTRPNFLISNIDGKTGTRPPEHGRDVHGPERPPRHLLLEHAQLLADGVSPRPELALRAVRRQLPRHDRGRPRTASRRERRVGIPREGIDPENVGGPGEDQHVDRRDEADLRGARPATARCSPRPATWCSGATSTRSSAPSTPRPARCCGRQTLGGPIQNSTITYAVNGKQYVAVFTGGGGLTGGLHRPGGHQADTAATTRSTCSRCRRHQGLAGWWAGSGSTPGLER